MRASCTASLTRASFRTARTQLRSLDAFVVGHGSDATLRSPTSSMSSLHATHQKHGLHTLDKSGTPPSVGNFYPIADNVDHRSFGHTYSHIQPPACPTVLNVQSNEATQSIVHTVADTQRVAALFVRTPFWNAVI